jgi:xylan 1,4-beta-xylosidase
VLASNGLDLPVLNVFRMLSKMSGQRVAVTSSAGLDAATIRAHGVRQNPDVSALASLDKTKLCVLVWNYHDDDVPGPAARIDLNIEGPPELASAAMTAYRIDQEHGNSFAAWSKLGSPEQPTDEQYAQLQKAGQLAQDSTPFVITKNGLLTNLELTLPRQAVSLLVFNWK